GPGPARGRGRAGSAAAPPRRTKGVGGGDPRDRAALEGGRGADAGAGDAPRPAPGRTLALAGDRAPPDAPRLAALDLRAPVAPALARIGRAPDGHDRCHPTWPLRPARRAVPPAAGDPRVRVGVLRSGPSERDRRLAAAGGARPGRRVLRAGVRRAGPAGRGGAAPGPGGCRARGTPLGGARGAPTRARDQLLERL